MPGFSKIIFVNMAHAAWRYAGAPQRKRIVLFYALLGIANIFVALQPIVFAHIISTAQRGGPNALGNTLFWSAIYGGSVLAFWLFHAPARLIERQTAFWAYKHFQTDAYSKVTDMPLRWHQDHHSGNTINRINKAGQALLTFGQNQFVGVQTFVRFLGMIAVLAFYSIGIAFASLLVLLFLLFAIRWFDKFLIPMIQRTNEKHNVLNAGLYDYVGNIVTILTLRLQKQTDVELERRQEDMRREFWPQITLNEQKWALMNIALVGTQAVLVGVYVILHLRHGEPFDLGPVAAIFQSLLIITQLFATGSLWYEQLTYQHTDFHGVDGLLADHAKLTIRAEADTPATWQNLRLSHLSFTHHADEENLHHLRDVSLTIKAGQKIALIGGSGSGKTTLLTLMRGLYDAQKVTLHMDGLTFDSLKPLSRFTSLVPQDSEIFENTIRYNLVLGIPVPEEQIQQALSLTTFDEVLPQLDQGLETDIRERGVNLSGGQKQRLALARGLIAAQDSSLVLLDEPTSSVDMPTEKKIIERLFQLFADKTIIVTMHRLHLLPRFDHIVFMKDGTILEQGTFSELVARRGTFYALWQQQTEVLE